MGKYERPPRKISNFENFMLGAFGGMCTVLSGHPLDTIKVRLQTMPKPAPGSPPMYTSTLDCAKKTIKYEGVRGLYKGMATPLTGAPPIFAISYLGYGLGKDLISMGQNKKLTWVELFAAGAFSGIFTTAVMAPGERIKTLIQVQQGGGPQTYSGPIDVVQKLYKMGGIKSIFKGTMATLLREVPGGGVYYMTYEVVRESLTPKDQQAGLGVMRTAFAGGMAGFIYWGVGTPADVIKSRLQSAPEGKYPNGIRSVFSELMAEGGPLALYKGLTPVMLRAFIANAVYFLSLECAKTCVNWTIDKFNKDDE